MHDDCCTKYVRYAPHGHVCINVHISSSTWDGFTQCRLVMCIDLLFFSVVRRILLDQYLFPEASDTLFYFLFFYILEWIWPRGLWWTDNAVVGKRKPWPRDNYTYCWRFHSFIMTRHTKSMLPKLHIDWGPGGHYIFESTVSTLSRLILWLSRSVDKAIRLHVRQQGFWRGLNTESTVTIVQLRWHSSHCGRRAQPG